MAQADANQRCRSSLIISHYNRHNVDCCLKELCLFWYVDKLSWTHSFKFLWLLYPFWRLTEEDWFMHTCSIYSFRQVGSTVAIPWHRGRGGHPVHHHLHLWEEAQQGCRWRWRSKWGWVSHKLGESRMERTGNNPGVAGLPVVLLSSYQAVSWLHDCQHQAILTWYKFLPWKIL